MINKTILANTPFQVQNGSVGIEIFPGGEKAISLTADFKYTKVTVDWRYLFGEDVLYKATDETVTVEDTTYYKFISTDEEDFYTLTDFDHITIMTEPTLYEYVEGAMVEAGSAKKYVHRPYNNFWLVAEDKISDYKDGRSSNYPITTIAGLDVVTFTEGNYDYAGVIADSEDVEYGTLTSETISAISIVAGKTQWEFNVDGTTYVWVDDKAPKKGDDIYSSAADDDYNQFEVKDSHIILDPEGTVDATLSYSVTGETWTDFEDTITDANNAVCNIPAGMYLMLDQDAVITEK